MIRRIPGKSLLAALSVDDLESIAQGIEHFIMCGDPNVDRLWAPYVRKLRKLAEAPPSGGEQE